MPEEEKVPNPTINLVPCKSSNLSATGYDRDSKVMDVVFLGGGKYRFYDVPEILWENFIHAESMGSYFGHVIRRAGFKSVKLG